MMSIKFTQTWILLAFLGIAVWGMYKFQTIIFFCGIVGIFWTIVWIGRTIDNDLNSGTSEEYSK